MGYVFQQSQLTTPRLAGEIVTPIGIGEQNLLERVLEAFDIRDLAVGEHARRMGAVAGLLAERLGLGRSQAWMIRSASSLHDIGKLTVRAGILWKPGALDEAERAEVERHPVAGYQMLRRADTPVFRLAATIALTHHERWDGKGYPLGLCAEEIPLVGRIAAVADVFDALLSVRPYRPALRLNDAADALQDGRGSHFEPAVIDALFSDLGGALAVRR